MRLIGRGMRQYSGKPLNRDLGPITTPDGELRFPTVSGYNLEGERIDFPQALTAPATVLLVAFEQVQQFDIDTWLPMLAEWQAELGDDLNYFELPTVQRMGPLRQSYLDMWMVMGIEDQGARERTVTLYLNQREFLDRLDLEHYFIHVLLVDAAGAIRWQAAGRYDDDTAAELYDHIRHLIDA